MWWNLIRFRGKPLFLTLVATAVIVNGCGSLSSSAVPTALPITPTATAPPPTPTPDASVTETVSVTDEDGYTFDVTFQYSPQYIEKSVANDKPGYASAIIRFGLSISITNTTPGRTLTFKTTSGITAPHDQPMVILFANWGADHPICSWEENISRDSCSLWLGFARISHPLAPGETRDLEVFSGSERTLAGLSGVPEDVYATVVPGLENPGHLSIMYLGDDRDRFTGSCPYKPNFLPTPLSDQCPGYNSLPQPLKG